MKMYTQGDIVHIPSQQNENANLIHRGRPAIIISRNCVSKYANFVSVVYLTTKNKNSMGSHIKLKTGGKDAIALCEQITSLPKEEVGAVMGHISQSDMLKVSVGIIWANVSEALCQAIYVTILPILHIFKKQE